MRARDTTIYVDGGLTIRGVTEAVVLEMEPPESAQTARGGMKAGFPAPGPAGLDTPAPTDVS